MGASDFRRLDIRVGMRLEFAVAGTIDCTGKTDSRIACGLEPLDVSASVWRVAHDEEFLSRLHPLKRVDDEVRIVFRFEAAHI